MRPRTAAEEWGAAGPRRPALVKGDTRRQPFASKRPEAPRVSFHDLNSRMAALERAPVFFTFRDATLRALARRVRRIVVPAGEMVLSQGDAGDTIFFIERGRCRVVVEKRPSIV